MNRWKKFFRQLFRSPEQRGISLGRHRTRDGAVFTFRMGAGSSGDVNRTHPASIEPCQLDATNPPLFYGCACVLDGTSHNLRRVIAADTAITELYGFASRPFPIQQSSGGPTATFGGGTPPTNQPIDILRWGYILAPVVGNAVKGGAVFVWVAASGGGHTQGGLEVAASAGNTAALSGRYTFNGPQDASGIVEVQIR